MARLARYTQQIFGSSAGANQMAKFGSLAAAAPATFSGATITPTLVQTLSNYLTGWFGAVIGANSPAIEDMNAICYLYAYQLTYLMQMGIAEYDAGTIYFKGCLVNDATGVLYVSLTDSNTGNALSSTTNWAPYVSGVNTVAVNPASGTYASPYAMVTADLGKTFLVNSANGAMQFNLPAPANNYRFKVKDVGALFGTNNCTIHRNAAEKIELVASDYIAQAPGGEWEFSSNGTDWFITGR